MKRNFIRPLLGLFGYVLLLACGLRPPEVPPAASRAVQALPAWHDGRQERELVGDQAIADLRSWYNDTRTNCGSESRPAFLCTGVMLRVTENNQAFLPWNPNPSSTGVSFSWLRSDTGFATTAYSYRNGFIFYPKDVGAAGSDVINVLCVFPHDAGTTSRDANGCGKHSQGGDGSRPCDQQGIATGNDWITHFNALPNKYTGQCGWNVRAGAASTAAYFRAFIDGRKRMNAGNWNIQNEVRMASWAQNAVVPLRAFFYLSGNSSARDKAKDDQVRYKAAFNQFAPVVQLSLPTSSSGSASFTYDETEQAVPDPGAGPGPEPGGDTVDFESIPLQQGVLQLRYDDGSLLAMTIVANGFSIVGTSVKGMSGHYLDAPFGTLSLYPRSGSAHRRVSLDLKLEAGIRIAPTVYCGETRHTQDGVETGTFAFECPPQEPPVSLVVFPRAHVQLDNVRYSDRPADEGAVDFESIPLQQGVLQLRYDDGSLLAMTIVANGFSIVGTSVKGMSGHYLDAPFGTLSLYPRSGSAHRRVSLDLKLEAGIRIAPTVYCGETRHTQDGVETGTFAFECPPQEPPVSLVVFPRAHVQLDNVRFGNGG